MSFLKLGQLTAILLLPTLASASDTASPSLVFPTNLDQPKLIFSVRDSVNYQFPDDVLAALTKINANRGPEEQIKFVTYGHPYTMKDLVSFRVYDAIPNVPLIDPAKRAADGKLPWYKHVPMQVRPWMQDTVEVFEDQNGIGALWFMGPYQDEFFLTMEQRRRAAVLQSYIDSDEYTPNENGVPPNVELEEMMAAANIETRKREAEKNWVAGLGIKNVKTFDGLNAMGGDFEALPGNFIVHSIDDNEGMGAIDDWLKGTRYEGRTHRMDADWLQVGHVDELVSVVPSKDACGFAILTMNPKLGLDLLKTEKREKLANIIPKTYQAMKPDGFDLTKFVMGRIYDHVALGKTSPETAKEVQKGEQAAKHVSAVIGSLKAAYAKANPACTDLKVIELPVVLTCDTHSAKLNYCKTLVANPVNSIVLGRDVLVPNPFFPSFRAEITKRLTAAGLTPHFVNTALANMHAGNAHCASNVVRQPTK